jgi:teichuronic acid biosynthesis glycosyltransferase TuaG
MSPPNTEEVTIVTPVYNGEHFIDSYFKNLLNQDLLFKLIIYNDASTDKTDVLLREYKNLVPFEVDIINSDFNQGPGMGRYIAIQKVDTEFVAFCDIDDLWPSNKLLNQIELMKKYNSKWSYHGRQIFINGEATRRYIKAKKIKNTFDLLSSRNIGLSSVVLRSEEACILPSLENEYFAEDYIWWAYLCNQIGPPLAINDLYYKYNIHNSSISKNKFKMAIAVFNIYVIKNNIPLRRPVAFLSFIIYAFKSLIGLR